MEELFSIGSGQIKTENISAAPIPSGKTWNGSIFIQT
jgi:hypothetical protein